jgi:hypothetical protein
MLQPIVLILALLAYALSLAAITSMHSSDAAGNGLAQAWAVFVSLGLWVLLGILVLTARWKLVTLVLFGACAAANIAAVALLMDNFYRARWPLVVPAASPLLIIALAMWPPAAPTALWTALAALSLVPWPAHLYRSRYGTRDRAQAAAAWKAGEPQRIEQERLQNIAAFDKLNDDSPLSDWLAFTNSELRERAWERIRRLKRRQQDAETMMRQRMDYIVRDLPELDLEPTPVICEGSRRCLRELVRDMRPSPNNRGRIYFTDAARIQEYKGGIEWIARHGCPLNDELAELETVLGEYQDTPERAKFLAFVRSLRTR